MAQKKLAAIAGVAILSSFFTGIVVTTDQVLLKKAKDNQIEANLRNTLPLKLQSREWEKLSDSYGKFIKEGDFTNRAIFENRHHDSPDYIYNAKEPNNSLWIFGDSWGAAIKSNEKTHKTIQKSTQNKNSIRITGVVSYSPLLMNLAYRQRLKAMNEHPNQIAIFIDQTDLGDDWCRYRPYVIRDKNGRLEGVTHNNRLNLSGGAALVSYYKLLGKLNSGIAYAIKSRSHLISTQSMELPGITGCNYEDLLSYQLGQKTSPNGSKTTNQINYFKKTLSDFIREIKSNAPNSQIILFSHDWAQHHLASNEKDFMPNNISTLLSELSKSTKIAKHVHINYPDHYRGLSIGEVFMYPNDKFSHLIDSSILSSVIQSSFNAFEAGQRLIPDPRSW